MTDRHGDEVGGKPEAPALEWIASAVGLLLTLGVLGVIGWQAARGSGDQPPAVAVAVERVVQTPAGHVVEIVAVNRSPATAAGVEIEGTLKAGGREVATSTTTIAYVPGHSERQGGLFFKEDPRAHQLELRALGYEKP